MSHEATKLHERDDTEKEGSQTRETKGSSLAGCKSKPFSLPFSVESLISDRGTSRTSYSSHEASIVLPCKPVSMSVTEDRLRLSPMALYADKGFQADSVAGLADSKKADMDMELSEKGQSGWFQTPSYTTPPRKSSPIALQMRFYSKKFLFCLSQSSFKDCLAEQWK